MESLRHFKNRTIVGLQTMMQVYRFPIRPYRCSSSLHKLLIRQACFGINKISINQVISLIYLISTKRCSSIPIL